MSGSILSFSQGDRQDIQTSNLYQLLLTYRDFFAEDENLTNVTSILRSMTCRWNKSKRDNFLLNAECKNCGQLFKNNDRVSLHQKCKKSNCEKTKLLLDQALRAFDRRPTEAIDNSPIIYQFGNINISKNCMTTLAKMGETVEDSIIDAFQNISQQLDWESYYFHLNFFQILVTKNGYDFKNVQDRIQNTDIFNKTFIYIPIVYNGHYILVVIDIKEKIIQCLDPLGIRRSMIMNSILSYLSDVFYMKEREKNETFDRSSWTLINFITEKKKLQFNSTDCGIFLMKFVLLLRESGDIFSLSQQNVNSYRQELVKLFEASSRIEQIA